jgi:hypothetical protein
MAAGNTYVAIATANGTGSSGSVTFSSIPATYTDLVLIVSGTLVSGGDSGLELRFNGTGSGSTSYSGTLLDGNGTAASSARQTNVAGANNGLISSNAVGNSVIQIMNYANTTTYKTILGRGNLSNLLTRASVYLWRDTPAAINAIEVRTGAGNYSTSTTFSLYGIKAA